MTETPEKRIEVLVAADFTDERIDQLNAIAPELHVQRVWPDVPEEAWNRAEVLYTIRHFPNPMQVPNLRWVQLHYAGAERALEQPLIQSKDITVTNASGIHARQMAEYSLMMIMAFNYQLPQMMAEQQAKIWREDRYDFYAPVPMQQQTVGIAGYGSIGRELARLASTLGMRVLASKRDVKRPAESEGDYSPPGTGDPEGDIPERIYPGEAIAVMAAECDYLVVLLPMTDATHHAIDEKVFKAMKPGGILINAARGGVVDEEALVRALKSGQIGGAALDVFEQEPLPQDSPLWTMENVIISPHVSGNSSDYNGLAAELFAENLKRYVAKRPLMNIINRDAGY